jgi:hypothetical protein
LGSEVCIKYVHLSSPFIWLGTLLFKLIRIFFTLFFSRSLLQNRTLRLIFLCIIFNWRPFRYNQNNIGLKMESCSIPCFISVQEDFLLSLWVMSTNCFWCGRYSMNHKFVFVVWVYLCSVNQLVGSFHIE